MPAAHPLPPPPASKCGCGVCPAPQARAKRAPRTTRATPAQAFRAPLRRKKRGLPLQQARRAIAPFALPPRQALPRLPLQAPGAPHPARASVSSVRRTQETRLAAPSLSGTPEPSAPHHPSEVWRAAALQNTFRIPGSFSKSSIWRRNPARARDRLPASSGRPASQTCAVDSAALRQQGNLTPAAACAGRKRVPCGHLGRRPKATWRREQIQGLRAASAQNADICEVSTAQPLTK